MRDETVRDALYHALDDDGGDAVSQTALADWHEERGDEAEAACLRWIVRNGRRPGRFDRQTIFGKCFWSRLEAAPILEDGPARLPVPLWLALKDNDERVEVGSFKSYQSPSAAYRAVIAAWSRVGEPVPEVE